MYESHVPTRIWLLIFFACSQATAETTVDVTADAKLIKDSNRAELIVMRIMPFRSQDQRKQINDMVGQLSGAPLIDLKTYMPATPGTRPYLDLCYVLLCNDKITILTRYIAYFFEKREEMLVEGKDEQLMIIIMLMVDDMPKFIQAYNDLEDRDDFDKAVDDQEKPFKNMFKVWAGSTRPPDGPIDTKAVDQEATALLDEKKNWDDERDQLEKVLMKSSYAMAKAIIAKYEEKQKHPIEDDIKAIIKNEYLVDAYSSLATFAKDKYKCLAQKLHDQSDNNDAFATWNIMIAILKPDEWKKIDASFKKDNDNIGVVEFISKNIWGDFVLMETFANLIDSSYKPKFLERPPPIASQQDQKHDSPPPVPSTTVKPK